MNIYSVGPVLFIVLGQALCEGKKVFVLADV